MINEGKPKYMIVTKSNQLDQNRSLKIENYCFENVESFKYLGVDINSRNNYHEKIKLRIRLETTGVISRYKKYSGPRHYQRN